jgi:hypothetical protein
MTIYLFYQRDDDGTHVVARLEDGVFSGPDAEIIESLLRERGYPKNGEDPERLIHGSRLWAARVREDETGKGDIK